MGDHQFQTKVDGKVCCISMLLSWVESWGMYTTLVCNDSLRVWGFGLMEGPTGARNDFNVSYMWYVIMEVLKVALYLVACSRALLTMLTGPGILISPVC